MNQNSSSENRKNNGFDIFYLILIKIKKDLGFSHSVF